MKLISASERSNINPEQMGEHETYIEVLVQTEMGERLILDLAETEELMRLYLQRTPDVDTLAFQLSIEQEKTYGAITNLKYQGDFDRLPSGRPGNR